MNCYNNITCYCYQFCDSDYLLVTIFGLVWSLVYGVPRFNSASPFKQIPARIGECMNSGMCLSGNIRTRENSVSQIGMKPGRHITGNARRRECNEKCKDDWILVKTLTNQLICVQFPIDALLHVNQSYIAL